MSYGYSFQSATRQVLGLGARMLVTLVGLSLLGAILKPLLLTAIGVVTLALALMLVARGALFRWRGW